jgi:putative NADH-flavin reductase
MKIKLNPIQKTKLMEAVQKENAYKQQFNTARMQLQEAMKSRQDIFEMICDVAGIDPKNSEEQFQIKGDEIILNDKGKTTSDRIRNELKKVKPGKVKSNGHAKVKV